MTNIGGTAGIERPSFKRFKRFKKIEVFPRNTYLHYDSIVGFFRPDRTIRIMQPGSTNDTMGYDSSVCNNVQLVSQSVLQSIRVSHRANSSFWSLGQSAPPPLSTASLSRSSAAQCHPDCGDGGLVALPSELSARRRACRHA